MDPHCPNQPNPLVANLAALEIPDGLPNIPALSVGIPSNQGLPGIQFVLPAIPSTIPDDITHEAREELYDTVVNMSVYAAQKAAIDAQSVQSHVKLLRLMNNFSRMENAAAVAANNDAVPSALMGSSTSSAHLQLEAPKEAAIVPATRPLGQKVEETAHAPVLPKPIDDARDSGSSDVNNNAGNISNTTNAAPNRGLPDDSSELSTATTTASIPPKPLDGATIVQTDSTNTKSVQSTDALEKKDEIKSIKAHDESVKIEKNSGSVETENIVSRDPLKDTDTSSTENTEKLSKKKAQEFEASNTVKSDSISMDVLKNETAKTSEPMKEMGSGQTETIVLSDASDVSDSEDEKESKEDDVLTDSDSIEILSHKNAADVSHAPDADNLLSEKPIELDVVKTEETFEDVDTPHWENTEKLPEDETVEATQPFETIGTKNPVSTGSSNNTDHENLLEDQSPDDDDSNFMRSDNVDAAVPPSHTSNQDQTTLSSDLVDKKANTAIKTVARVEPPNQTVEEDLWMSDESTQSTPVRQTELGGVSSETMFTRRPVDHDEASPPRQNRNDDAFLPLTTEDALLSPNLDINAAEIDQRFLDSILSEDPDDCWVLEDGELNTAVIPADLLDGNQLERNAPRNTATRFPYDPLSDFTNSLNEVNEIDDGRTLVSLASHEEEAIETIETMQYFDNSSVAQSSSTSDPLYHTSNMQYYCDATAPAFDEMNQLIDAVTSEHAVIPDCPTSSVNSFKHPADSVRVLPTTAARRKKERAVVPPTEQWTGPVVDQYSSDGAAELLYPNGPAEASSSLAPIRPSSAPMPTVPSNEKRVIDVIFLDDEVPENTHEQPSSSSKRSRSRRAAVKSGIDEGVGEKTPVKRTRPGRARLESGSDEEEDKTSLVKRLRPRRALANSSTNDSPPGPSSRTRSRCARLKSVALDSE